MGRAVRFRHELADIVADDLGGRVAEQRLGRRAEGLDGALVVDDHDRFRCRVENRLQPRLPPAQVGLAAPQRGAVSAVPRHQQRHHPDRDQGQTTVDQDWPAFRQGPGASAKPSTASAVTAAARSRTARAAGQPQAEERIRSAPRSGVPGGSGVPISTRRSGTQAAPLGFGRGGIGRRPTPRRCRSRVTLGGRASGPSASSRPRPRTGAP